MFLLLSTEQEILWTNKNGYNESQTTMESLLQSIPITVLVVTDDSEAMPKGPFTQTPRDNAMRQCVTRAV